MCPLEQMVRDHQLEVAIFEACMGVWTLKTLGRGKRMWYLATVSMTYDEARYVLGEEWCLYLQRKYP